MKSNLKVLLFTRKELKEELDINNIRKKFKLFNVIYDHEFIKNKSLKEDMIFNIIDQKIISDKILKKAFFAAVNFHPGPPEFRGIGCANLH